MRRVQRVETEESRGELERGEMGEHGLSATRHGQSRQARSRHAHSLARGVPNISPKKMLCGGSLSTMEKQALGLGARGPEYVSCVSAACTNLVKSVAMQLQDKEGKHTYQGVSDEPGHGTADVWRRQVAALACFMLDFRQRAVVKIRRTRIGSSS